MRKKFWRAVSQTCTFLLFWAYSFMVLWVLLLSRYTAEEHVLLRITASILSDIVWIPLGIALWSILIFSIFTFLLYKPKTYTGISLLKILSFFSAGLIALFFHDLMFKLLLIPIIFYLFSCFVAFGKAYPSYRIKLPVLFIIGILFSHYGFQLIPNLPHDEMAGDIKVISWNVYTLADEKDRQDQIEFLRNGDFDIICLSEIRDRADYEFFRENLEDIYPYFVPAVKENLIADLMIISRFNTVSEQGLAFAGTDKSINTVLNIDGRRVLVTNLHLTTVGHHVEYAARTPERIGENIPVVAEFELYKDRKKFDEANAVLESISGAGMPAIICGDFNDTPNSRVYQLFREKYRNACEENGWGLCPTFGQQHIAERIRRIPLPKDFLRIDHIFTSTEFEIIHAGVRTKAPGSDHKPVVATLRFK